MKFSINQSEFLSALQVVEKGSSTRGASPILSGVLLQASVDMLTLSTTNGTLSIRSSINALIDEEGEAVIPNKLLVDVVKSLPNEALVLEANETQGKITCDKTSFDLKAFAPADFPSFPEIQPENSISVPGKKFARMVEHVNRDVSRDESRAILTGIHIKAHEGTLQMIATDSYRLAIIETDFDNNGQDFSAVISGSFLTDLASLCKSSDDPIKISIAENQILVELGSTTFVNRRIEGQYPDVTRLLPKDHSTRVTFDVAQLIQTVRRVSLMTNKTAPIKFDINADTQSVVISTMSPDIGSASETISAKVEGNNIETAFNAFYTLDGLSAIHTKQVYLDSQESMRPSVFHAESPEKFTYLIMPVRMSE